MVDATVHAEAQRVTIASENVGVRASAPALRACAREGSHPVPGFASEQPLGASPKWRQIALRQSQTGERYSQAARWLFITKAASHTTCEMLGYKSGRGELVGGADLGKALVFLDRAADPSGQPPRVCDVGGGVARASEQTRPDLLKPLSLCGKSVGFDLAELRS